MEKEALNADKIEDGRSEIKKTGESNVGKV